MEQEQQESYDNGSEVRMALEAMEQGESEASEHAQAIAEAAEAVESPESDVEAEEVSEPTEEPEQALEGDSEGEELPEEVKDEKLSGSWAKVMRLHSQVQKQQSELKERERQIEERMQQLEHQSKMSELAKQDPVAFLEQQGISYEDAYERWTKRILGQEEAPRRDKPTIDPEEIEQKIAERVQQQLQQYQQQQQAEKWVHDAQSVVADDKYEPIRLLGAEEEVTNLAAMYLQEHGELLTPRQAADMILQEAEKRINQIASVVGKNNKDEASSKPLKPSKASKTLKNDLDASSLPKPEVDDEPSDSRTELRRALALLD